jgi:hypothetical protein
MQDSWRHRLAIGADKEKQLRMNAADHPVAWEVGALLRGDTGRILSWTERWNAGQLARNVAVIFLGAGLYGLAMGWWRDPLQALYVAVKLPLIILLTALGNALLNAMLAPLLGLNIPFRRSFLAILMSFAIASAILGSFSPLLGFLIWNAPAMTPNFRESGGTYSFIMLTHVAVITFAGVAANLRLKHLLRAFGGGAGVARRVLFAWLAGNLFLGSQLSWILRPFIGVPGLPVQFLRDDPLNGNFYEAVFHSFIHLLNFD